MAPRNLWAWLRDAGRRGRFLPHAPATGLTRPGQCALHPTGRGTRHLAADSPSGHNTYAGAAEQVLTALVGPRTAKSYTIGSPTAPGVTRTYTSWHQLTAENVDARVWSGIHTRTADTVGVTLGQVAANALREAQRLFR